MTCSGEIGAVADIEESVEAMRDELRVLTSKMDKLFSTTKDMSVPPNL